MSRGVEPPGHQNENNEAGPEHGILATSAQSLGAFIVQTQAPDNEEQSQEATDTSSRSLSKLSLWLVLKIYGTVFIWQSSGAQPQMEFITKCAMTPSKLYSQRWSITA